MAKILELSLTEATRKKVLEQNYQQSLSEFQMFCKTYDPFSPKPNPSHLQYTELLTKVKNNLAKMNGITE